MLPEDLPVRALEEPFKAALSRGPVVITSPTGSGKSTWVPVWAAAEAGRVLVVEPRRVACRSLARFVARSLGERLGEGVGYAVRHDDRLGPKTRIGFVTPGVALQRLHGQGLGDAAVILDEFHQRGLETDLLLSLLLARAHRRLCVLSATLDGPRVARFISGEHLEAEGRCYPIQIRTIGQDPVPQGKHLEERVFQALSELPEAEQGDVLVFLPGKAEITACAARIQGHPVFDPLPLHAQLPPREQDLAFEPSQRRRVILSTNVAETSVTLPWVRWVIDSGLVRRTVYREGRGVLSLTPIAMDAADQRAGRAGRLGPGICLRLWSASGKLEARTPPEIMREDLSQLVLQAARFGHQLEELSWLDAPRDFAVEEARGVLHSLGLMSADQLTEAGVRAGSLPVDPMLGRLLVAGKEQGVLPDMLLLVATLAVGRAIFIPGKLHPPEGTEADPLTDARCDVTARILSLRRPDLARGRLQREAHAEAGRIARQLARLMGQELASADHPVDRARLEQALFLALPGSAFARRPKREAWGNGKVEVVLDRETLIDPKVSTILVVDQHLLVERGRRIKRRATCCMPVSVHRLRELGAGQIQVAAVRIKKQQILAELRWSIGTTLLEKEERVPQGAAARTALVQLLIQGRLFPAEITAAGEELAAFNLHQAMARQRVDPQELNAWLAGRVEELGFDCGADLPLLNAKDFTLELLPATERASIDVAFPRALKIGALGLRVSYDPSRRLVTLRATRSGQPPPRLDFLPSWSGWSVAYDNGKHTVMLRGRR